MPSLTTSSRAKPLELASTIAPPRRPSATAGVADQWKTLAPHAALRGDFARALDLYRSLAAVEPNVPLHRIRAGDCLVKMGQKREALGEYCVAADAYLALGMQVHARSALRLVLGIVPGDADATARLAALDARVRGVKPAGPMAAPSRAGAIPARPGSDTPTAPEAVVRAEQAAARAAKARTEPQLVILPETLGVIVPPPPEAFAKPPAPARTLEKAIETALEVTPLPAAKVEKALAVTPVVARRADLRAPVGRAVTPAPSPREILALEFADLDDDADGIWIELDGIFDVPPPPPKSLAPVGLEETEPVTYFAANDDDDSSPSRHSAASPGGPSGSIVDEETKPVPPPES